MVLKCFLILAIALLGSAQASDRCGEGYIAALNQESVVGLSKYFDVSDEILKGLNALDSMIPSGEGYSESTSEDQWGGSYRAIWVYEPRLNSANYLGYDISGYSNRFGKIRLHLQSDMNSLNCRLLGVVLQFLPVIPKK